MQACKYRVFRRTFPVKLLAALLVSGWALVWSGPQAFAQRPTLYSVSPDIWQTLGDLKWKDRPDGGLQPVFGQFVQQMAGQEITITGYLIPAELAKAGEDNIYIISALPANSCFFCGGAGAETVMEVHVKPGTYRKLRGEQATFTGTLTLNPDDDEHLPYILTDAAAKVSRWGW